MKLIIKFITDKGIKIHHKVMKAGNLKGAEKLLFKTLFKEKTISNNPLTISIKARQPKFLKHILRQNGFESLPDFINKFLKKEGLDQSKDYAWWVE